MTGLGLTLLVALAAALVLGALAHRLRLPPMLGYIAAGHGGRPVHARASWSIARRSWRSPTSAWRS